MAILLFKGHLYTGTGEIGVGAISFLSPFALPSSEDSSVPIPSWVNRDFEKLRVHVFSTSKPSAPVTRALTISPLTDSTATLDSYYKAVMWLPAFACFSIIGKLHISCLPEPTEVGTYPGGWLWQVGINTYMETDKLSFVA